MQSKSITSFTVKISLHPANKNPSSFMNCFTLLLLFLGRKGFRFTLIKAAIKYRIQTSLKQGRIIKHLFNIRFVKSKIQQQFNVKFSFEED